MISLRRKFWRDRTLVPGTTVPHVLQNFIDLKTQLTTKNGPDANNTCTGINFSTNKQED